MTRTIVAHPCPCGCDDVIVTEEGQPMTEQQERELREHYRKQFEALPPDKRPFAKARAAGVQLSLDTATGKITTNRPRTPEDIEALLMAAATGQGPPQVRMALLAEEDCERARTEKAAGVWTDQTPEPSARRIDEILAEFAANTGADVGAPASARMSIAAQEEAEMERQAAEAGPWGGRTHNAFSWEQPISDARAAEVEAEFQRNVDFGSGLS
jgi:hypothetical protein